MSKVAERKIINEKIAKVREVVHGVSTNDIILALYSLDMNVERTIQAFCEADGASEVLDDWVRPSGGSSKNKNKKKKNKQPVESVPSAAPATAPVAAAAAAATVAPSTASASKVVKAAPPVKAGGSTQQLPAKTAPQTNGFVIQDKPQEAKPHNGKNIPVTEQIQQTFKALRAAITDREKELLSGCGVNSKFVDANFDHLISLIQKFGSVAETSPRGASTAPTVAAGMPKAVSPVQAAAIKHATSQSSISSSLGADSGVNLSPTHKEEKKGSPENKPKPAKVVSGGIMMQSDALTPEQLEALQRSLADQLAACGIDASILSGVTGGDMPVRRPRPRADGPKRGGVVKNERNSIRPQLSIL
ncbi:hypothetical protein GCK32_002943 [Trichostrongylus colubriformis]|uniref:Uncharacterized protein n=1 Tax=Trichostrongylus colubriformis TaxID=6319 RepID=A0AAN8IL56_TRICO